MSASSTPFNSSDDIRPLRLAETSPNPAGLNSADNELFMRQTFAQNPRQEFELLFREYYGPLCSHAIRFVYSRDVARDLVSDLFAVFWQKALYQEISISYRAYYIQPSETGRLNTSSVNWDAKPHFQRMTWNRNLLLIFPPNH